MGNAALFNRNKLGYFDFSAQCRGTWGPDIVTDTFAKPTGSYASSMVFTDYETGVECISSGSVKSFTTFIGVLKENIVAGGKGSFVTTCSDIWLPCNSSDTFAAGTVVYWNAAARELTTTSTSNIKCGIALAPYIEASTDPFLTSILYSATPLLRINLFKEI
jgi:predicted RecA/RadA family phage recombinase